MNKWASGWNSPRLPGQVFRSKRELTTALLKLGEDKGWGRQEDEDEHGNVMTTLEADEFYDNPELEGKILKRIGYEDDDIEEAHEKGLQWEFVLVWEEGAYDEDPMNRDFGRQPRGTIVNLLVRYRTNDGPVRITSILDLLHEYPDEYKSMDEYADELAEKRVPDATEPSYDYDDSEPTPEVEPFSYPEHY